MSSNQTGTPFETLLASSSLPEPGPEYFAARRRLWLTPRGTTSSANPTSGTRKRLEDLLNRPGAVYSQDIWNNHLEQIWKGVSSGGRLKVRLPLSVIIKIIHAGWLRDKTWPPGMEVADSDEQLTVVVGSALMGEDKQQN